MKDAIGYLRVSTKEQGRSGLGLAAQKFDIQAFGSREGFSVKSWYRDLQTGAGKDALLLRPGLAAALTEARAARCPLIVSRLDRLSRNVHFIASLMEHKVHFMVALFGKDVDDFTLHIYASIAEQERKMISERIKAAIGIAKRQGKRFGVAFKRKSWQRHVSALGRAALNQEANARAQAYRVYLEWALRQRGLNGRCISFCQAAAKLNARNIETPFGGRWMGHHLQRMARRLGIDHPLANVPEEVARIRVRGAFRRRPHSTVAQVIADLGVGTPNLLWKERANTLLRECRRAAANRSPLYQRMGWPIDEKTTTRLRVAAILKRHSQLTASQVIEMLGPELQSRLRLHWVQKIMRDCCGLYLRRSSKITHLNRKRGKRPPRRALKAVARRAPKMSSRS